MPELKLTYFDFDGGRGEPIRLALAYGDIPFEDDRIPPAEWPAFRDKTPLHQLPVMEVDGEIVTQTNSLLRYVGKLVGLYPEDALEALHCDEAMATQEDILCKIVPTLFIQDEEEKRKAREALVAGPLPLFLSRLNTMLNERGGRYFAGDRLSVADLKVFLWVRHLVSGGLDHVPADLVQQVAPSLADHFKRISTVPTVAAYYQKRAEAAAN
ncbi:MAG TPA: glutathione S-transferase [Xanthomonadales bacterium]|nr:glutathione S-transferase [Xanthomonadales bacterium]